MPRRAHPCSTPGCGGIALKGKCDDCKARSYNKRESGSRTYGREHRQRFRAGVLERDPICRDPSGCREPSTDADHWPLSLRTLLARGMDPNDPEHGRGLCHRHHSMHTARAQPGGWNRQ